MIELLKGNIKEGLGGEEFYESEDGEYIILEKPKEAQYLCSVWISPNMYKYNSYIMIFKNTIENITQVAEWADKSEPYQITSALEKLLGYYSSESEKRIIVGIGRNIHGENLINTLAGRPRRQYDFYEEKTRDASTNVISEKTGVIDDDRSKIGLINDLKYAFSKYKIFPLPGSNISVLKNIIIDRDKCIIPEKYEAYILALAGACRVLKEHPYRKPVDRTRIKALIQSRRFRNPYSKTA